MAEIEFEEKTPEVEERVIQIDRVTRVVKGGRRLRFRAIVVAGDKNGRVGVACEKGGDVSSAIQKATTKAKKSLENIPLYKTTIPHTITAEYAGAKVFLKPARQGTGVIAGGAVRAVLEVSGVKDVFSKIQGSSSKLNNVYATMKALTNLIDISAEMESKRPKKEDKKSVGKAEAEGNPSTNAPLDSTSLESSRDKRDKQNDGKASKKAPQAKSKAKKESSDFGKTKIENPRLLDNNNVTSGKRKDESSKSKKTKK